MLILTFDALFQNMRKYLTISLLAPIYFFCITSSGVDKWSYHKKNQHLTTKFKFRGYTC